MSILYVSFDRVEIGRMQVEYLVKHAPKGNYVLDRRFSKRRGRRSSA